MIRNETESKLRRGDRIGSAILGVGLFLLAVRRGPLLWRVAGAAAGASLLARAVAGDRAVKAAVARHSDVRPGSAAYAAKSQAIDEAVMASFPASDPPASRLPDEPPVNAAAKWAAARAAQTLE
jgi:hypothetical protein